MYFLEGLDGMQGGWGNKINCDFWAVKHENMMLVDQVEMPLAELCYCSNLRF